MQLLKSITGTFFEEYRIKINSFKHREWYPLHRQMIFVAFVNLWTNIAIKISFSSQVRLKVHNLHIYHVTGGQSFTRKNVIADRVNVPKRILTRMMVFFFKNHCQFKKCDDKLVGVKLSF